MALPKLDQPIYDLTLPSTNKKIKYRPFTVKEEKILLVAQQSKDVNQVALAIEQILTNCVLDYDIEDLAMFDIEYLMLNIRAKSVNNVISFTIQDPDTKQQIQMEIDIEEIEIDKKDTHDKIIPITKDVSLVMRYPGIKDIANMMLSTKEDSSEEKMIDTVCGFIRTVMQGEDIYNMKDFTETEQKEFVESLSSVTLKSIADFFQSMPAMKFEKKYKLEDGTEKTFVARGTETFFL